MRAEDLARLQEEMLRRAGIKVGLPPHPHKMSRLQEYCLRCGLTRVQIEEAELNDAKACRLELHSEEFVAAQFTNKK